MIDSDTYKQEKNLRKLILSKSFESVITIVSNSDKRFALTKYSNHHYTFTMMCDEGLLSVDLFPSDNTTGQRDFEEYFSKDTKDTEENTEPKYTSVIIHPYSTTDDVLVNEFIELIENS
jgi:hypothetical protein